MTDFWDTRNEDQLFRMWKEWSWWQAQAPGNDIEHFLSELYDKRIAKNEEPYKLIWGYENSSNFNPKESLGLLTGTQNLEPEAKWGKICTGGWWPKVFVFYWLVIKCHILTWDNLQIKGFYGPSRCCMCEENIETINHLLDECKVADSIWEKGAAYFKKNHHHKGWLDITIADWPMNDFKNQIVNHLWELLLGFTLWEIWNSIEAHLKETISLQQWMKEEFFAEENERIIMYDLGIGELPPNNLIARSIPATVSSPSYWYAPPAGSFC